MWAMQKNPVLEYNFGLLPYVKTHSEGVMLAEQLKARIRQSFKI